MTSWVHRAAYRLPRPFLHFGRTSAALSALLLASTAWNASAVAQSVTSTAQPAEDGRVAVGASESATAEPVTDVPGAGTSGEDGAAVETVATETNAEASSEQSTTELQGPVDRSSLADARALSRAFRASAERMLPAVVTVLSRPKSETDESSILDLIGGPEAQRFPSLGSGVIVSEDGIILTNHHVIADSERIEVRLPDGRQFAADESMSDPRSDLAIIRVEVDEPLPYAELGDSDNLFVGDWVLAIGSPFQLEASVSAGIISATGRWRNLSQLVSGQFLQTDAAINPGNSGGPLIDLEGRVVGISTAISTRTGGFQGIGFAIPINRANWIKDELLNYGKVRRGYVGVRLNPVDYYVARDLNLPANTGAYVNSVVPGYPGDKAGLEVGDVIIQFDGQRIDRHSDFAEFVQRSPLERPLELIVIRDGQRKKLTIELQARPN